MTQRKPAGAGQTAGLTIDRYKAGPYWAVRDARGELVCVCAYRKGAEEVVRRFALCGQALALAVAGRLHPARRARRRIRKPRRPFARLPRHRKE